MTWPGGSGEARGILLGAGGGGARPAALVLGGPEAAECRDPWALGFGAFLVRQGLLALVAERGGCGTDGPAGVADLEELADEALAALDFLRRLPQVEGEPVGLVGLGGGADVAAIVAAKGPPSAFVVAVSGGAAGGAGFDPMSWWWTVDAPVFFLFGDADPARLAADRARIEEEMVPEGLAVTVRVFPGAGDRLTASDRPDAPLRPDVAAALSSWLRERLR